MFSITYTLARVLLLLVQPVEAAKIFETARRTDLMIGAFKTRSRACRAFVAGAVTAALQLRPLPMRQGQ